MQPFVKTPSLIKQLFMKTLIEQATTSENKASDRPFKTFCLLTSILFYDFYHAQNYSINEDTKKIIDSTYNALLEKNQVMGLSLAIVDNGELVYATGYGFSDHTQKIKSDETTVYRISSITKSFTALSLLQLQEKNLLNINNSVKAYLPELKIESRFKDDNQIYIKDMLSHVSGLPCDISNGVFCDAPPDIDWVIRELNKQTTILPRNYKHAYSNVAYGLLGEVISKVNKTSYSDYLKTNIFIPLNMHSTYVESGEISPAKVSKAYYKNKEVKEPMIRDQGAGSIYSTVTDMSNYLLMFLNKGKFNDKQLVSRESLEEMEKNQLNNLYLNTNEKYGYGIHAQQIKVKDNKDSSIVTVIGHEGDTYAFHSDLKFIPELNVGVVILTNTDKGAYIVSASKLLRIYLKETRSKTLDYKYKPAKDSLSNRSNESICSTEEMIGNYNMGELIIPVKNEKRIKFKQGPVKITLLQKKSDPKTYKAKAIVYNLIPIKINDQEFTFVKINNDVYLKVIFPSSGGQDYVALRALISPVPLSWKNTYGNYKAIGKIYVCTDCPFVNMEGASLTLTESAGIICMKFKGKTADVKTQAYLTIISDALAVTGGINRGNGETVKILDNGNIYYSGFEFSKIK